MTPSRSVESSLVPGPSTPNAVEDKKAWERGYVEPIYSLVFLVPRPFARSLGARVWFRKYFAFVANSTRLQATNARKAWAAILSGIDRCSLRARAWLD